MLNQIYIHYINTLFVLESFIIKKNRYRNRPVCSKKIGIGIGHEKSWSVHHYLKGRLQVNTQHIYRQQPALCNRTWMTYLPLVARQKQLKVFQQTPMFLSKWPVFITFWNKYIVGVQYISVKTTSL